MTKEEAFKWYRLGGNRYVGTYHSVEHIKATFEEYWLEENPSPSLQSQIDSLKQEVEKLVSMVGELPCPKCGGSGLDYDRKFDSTGMSYTYAPGKCPKCHGSGKLKRPS